MQRREFLKIIGGFTAAGLPMGSLAHSNPLPKVVVFGSIGPRAIAAFVQGMHDFGWVEGQTVLIQRAVAQPDQLPALAAQLVSNKVDVIFAGTSQATQIAKNVTSTIPIVCLSGDPIAFGLVNSLARPGGNVPGVSLLAPQVSGKRLELLKEIVPRLERVAVFSVSEDPAAVFLLKETEAAAARLALKLQTLEVPSENAFPGAFAAATEEKVQAIVLTVHPVLDLGAPKIAALALQTNLPTMGTTQSFPKAGGLIAYGPEILAIYYRAAYYVDRILKGANPAELPVEQPTKFELVINLKTAKALGLLIPSSLLAAADEVIE